MITAQLSKLSDIATEAHTRIQQNFSDLDPVVGVSQNMRKSGIPADVMTIDCLKTNKRIILILHDQQPELVRYQFAYRDKDPEGQFEEIPFNDLTSDSLYEWIHRYFSVVLN
ncbi:hypothetical protein [Litoribacillus peritrichatus]|uniref:Uncharacterized protein n=1 Tax=Litoribacillus peritrichatus TaxID=718191 RepID=A0ABP7MQP3_9GAMM